MRPELLGQPLPMGFFGQPIFGRCQDRQQSGRQSMQMLDVTDAQLDRWCPTLLSARGALWTGLLEVTKTSLVSYSSVVKLAAFLVA